MILLPFAFADSCLLIELWSPQEQGTVLDIYFSTGQMLIEHLPGEVNVLVAEERVMHSDALTFPLTVLNTGTEVNSEVPTELLS